MRIQEFDPKKKYVISIPNDNLTAEDVELIKANLKTHGMDAVVIVGAEIEPERKYFGLYCEQCGYWWCKQDGAPYFYPAPEIANAQLNDRGYYGFEKHLYKVQEFGKEEYLSHENLKPNAEVCPALLRVLGDSALKT